MANTLCDCATCSGSLVVQSGEMHTRASWVEMLLRCVDGPPWAMFAIRVLYCAATTSRRAGNSSAQCGLTIGTRLTERDHHKAKSATSAHCPRLTESETWRSALQSVSQRRPATHRIDCPLPPMASSESASKSAATTQGDVSHAQITHASPPSSLTSTSLNHAD